MVRIDRVVAAFSPAPYLGARAGGVLGWLSATRHPQFGMRSYQYRAGADVGSSVVSVVFLRVPVFFF